MRKSRKCIKVLCLHPHLSMRAVKEMAALKQKGHKVILAYEGLGCSVHNGYGTFWDKVIKFPGSTFKGEYYFRRLFSRTYRKALAEIIESTDFQLIHTYSMPDTLAVAAMRYSGLPVIFDSRDISTGSDHFIMEDLKNSILNKLQDRIYKKVIKRYEKEANEKSDGRIYSSPEMLSYMHHKYSINIHRSIVLENYQTLLHVSKNRLKKLSDDDGGTHLVYTGNIYFDDMKRSTKLFKSFENDSIHLHIYPTGDNFMINSFKCLFPNSQFIHFHEPLSPGKLSAEIQKYDFGLVPHPPNIKTLNIRLVLPNKLFDYLAAGLPIVGRNTYALKNFIERHQVGFIYNNEEELLLTLKDAKDKYKICPEKFVMESHIDGVLKLYDQVLN